MVVHLMTLAPVYSRFFAFVLDMLIATVLFTLMFMFTSGYRPISEKMIFWQILICFFILPSLTTAVFSASFGKMFMGIEVLSTSNSKPVGFIKGLFREIANRLTFLFIGFLWIPFNSERKGFHDMIFKTIVVKKNA